MDAIKRALINELKSYEHLTFSYVQSGAPETGKAIYKAWIESTENGAPFPIYAGDNDAVNLYFTPEINLLYRTLHDIHHAEAYLLGGGTTKISDEKRLNCKMSLVVFNQVLKSHNLTMAIESFFKMYHDTVGQVLYYQKNKSFCVNQRSLTTQLCDSCKGLALLRGGKINQALQVMHGYISDCE